MHPHWHYWYGSFQHVCQNTAPKKDLVIFAKAANVSMLGQKTFAWVDKRLRQATGALHEPLGGVSVSLFGDIAQLPPVADRPLFAKSSIGGFSYAVYQMFSTVVILSQVLRQACQPSHPSIERATLAHSEWHHHAQ